MQELSTFISNHLLLSIATAVTLVLLTLIEFMRAKRNTQQLSPTRVTQLINRENAAVLDIRAQEAFKKGHIIGAASLNPQDVREGSKKVEKLKSKPVIVVCETGVESQKIASHLQKQGYDAYSLAGGLRAWREAQLPCVKE